MPLAIGGMGVAVLFLVVVFGAVLGSALRGQGGGDGPCPAGQGSNTADIPRAYLALYAGAGARYGVPWQILAAVGKVESDHGRGTGPGIRSGTNRAGAAGPMQFLPGTWRAFGVDGNGDTRKDIYDPADAVPAAAAYLRHNGAPRHMERALRRYNDADWYVKKVLHLAGTYAQGVDDGACADVSPAGTGQGAVAVRAALRWVGTPYSWGGGGLNGPTEGFGRGRGVVGFDCSGLTRYAWHQAGITLPRVAENQWRAFPHVPPGREQPGDLVFFKGASGSASRPGHVGLVIGGGRMVEAPRTGLPVRVSTVRNRSDLLGYARPGRR
ncbi:C40 family peptidase [Actinomadura craniellae]|nr:NlpC/P60 family protein [Actinomadura craniellae]